MSRGVTLLELLIVLVLMAVFAALVVPAVGRREGPVATADDALVSSARQTAVRRGEPLRLQLAASGTWSLTSQRDGALVDSGHITGERRSTSLLVDVLGGCVPTESTTSTATAFDPLSCAAALADVAPTPVRIP